MSLKEEQRRYPLIKQKLVGYRAKIVHLYEIAWRSWDRDPENHDGEPSGIMEMYEEIIRNLNRNEKSPYFARIIFHEDGQAEPTDVYIGKVGHVEVGDTHLIDWRAPISELYYKAALGKASYTTPEMVVQGQFLLKRQIKIEDDQVVSIYDFENAVSTDEFLQPYLTTSADNRLKSIVSTIQAEQDNIIRLPLNKNLVVQGVAGSGKTTVALHRLSYLMYNNRKYIKPKEFLIISPNKVFMSYISALLVDLDADQAYSYNLEGIFKEVSGCNWRVQAKHEQFEKLCEKGKSTDYLKFKSSKEFVELVDRFLEHLQERIFKKDLIIDGVKVLGGEKMFEYYKQVKMKRLLPTFDAWVDKVVFDLRINTALQEEIEANMKKEDVPFKTRLDIIDLLKGKDFQNT